MSAPLIDDLLAPEVVDNPYPYLAALRQHDPVHWSERHRAWLVTRFDDTLTALADERLSSNRVRQLLEALPDGRRARLAPILEAIGDWMVTTDPPDHTRLRAAANRAFRQARIIGLAERIGLLVDELLDDVVRRHDRAFVEHFAYPLPATVICELMGAPLRDRDRLREWSDELALIAFGAGGDERSERHQRALAALEEMSEYFGELITSRRREPDDDMVSSLLAYGDGEEELSESELRSMCALTLFAGNETTTNLLTNGLLALLRHPNQLDVLRNDPEAANRCIEELLRYDGPIKVLTRWVNVDTELRGHHIRKGERVFLVVSAANRDPDQFVDPDRLDVRRQPNVHVAFGRGIHTCIGQHLARIESRIALSRVVERLPELALGPEPIEWKPSLASRSMKELYLDYAAQ
jgi:cytochrome P450